MTDWNGRIVVDATSPVAALIGFGAVDCGDLKVARYLEPFAMTWIHMAIRSGGRSAQRILSNPPPVGAC